MTVRPTPSSPTAARSPGPASDGRERFSRRELDEVLSKYELGEVRSVREVPLGTPASPKAVVDCARGQLLLKRRARGVDAPEMVAFAHEVLLGCQQRGVCVPPLVGTRGDNNSMVQIDDRIYELFVYIEGSPDPRTPASAGLAGALLAELHKAMDALTGEASTRWTVPVEATVIDPARADRAGAVDAEIRASVRGVLERAAAHASGERALVHGDWHPGNLVFRGDEPVAVCDFDNARSGSRAREVAQGLVQFSLRRGAPGEPPEKWPAEADLDRLAAHWRGYRRARPDGTPRPQAVVGLLPGVLMEEVLGAATPDPRVVWMVLRKAQWVEDRADEIAGMLNV
ncbi:MAG: phosphotransferase [Phycisphaerales bacterium]|nr:phosphotransferase [Planctomycetota bacterium]MCH8508787.1 phosphotransferase [Phycisphaerales bacterium]